MEINQRIRKWLSSDRDYAQGVELLVKVSKKSKVVGKIAKGELKSRRLKLEYELRHYLALHPDKGAPVKEKTPAEPSKKIQKEGSHFSLIKKGEKIENFPAGIQRVIRENSSLYMQRGKLHKQMKELPEDNDPGTVEKRKELSSKIAKVSERLEQLYAAWNSFNTTGEDNSSSLFEGIKEKDPPADQKPLTVEDLKREKKNLQASLAKDRNQLEYQSKTKPKEGQPAPMPEGPKRIRLEKRIKAKEKQITEIDLLIAKQS